MMPSMSKTVGDGAGLPSARKSSVPMSLALDRLSGWFSTHCHDTTPVGRVHQAGGGGGVAMQRTVTAADD